MGMKTPECSITVAIMVSVLYCFVCSAHFAMMGTEMAGLMAATVVKPLRPVPEVPEVPAVRAAPVGRVNPARRPRSSSAFSASSRHAASEKLG